MATRPTSDRLRETLFNVLGPRVRGSRFADLYAGSGAVGIEAISRGADFVWFAENAPAAVAAIRANLSALKVTSGFAIEDRGVTEMLRRLARQESKVEIVFLDPPYQASEEYRRTLEYLGRKAAAVLSEGAVVVVEHARKQPLENRLQERYAALVRTRLLEQGDAGLSFYKVEGGE